MNPFSIDFQWLARESGDAIARTTLAEITITANGWRATEIEDLLAKTVRPGVRVSAFALAQWFASNWWRLLWEPERNTSSWKMSHKVGAAGEGYLWPDLTFISDGEAILIRGRSSPQISKQPVRYLNSFDVSVPANEFEGGMHSFIEAVVRRLSDTKTQAAELEALWQEILVERSDPELASWRKLEAIMGYDPDEAPDQIIEALKSAASEYGPSAVEEMAVESMENAVADIETLWGAPRREALPVVIPSFDDLKGQISGIRSSLFPWQRATVAARIAREVWSLSPGPVSTSTLADVLSVGQDSLENAIDVQGPMNAGFRNGDLNNLSVFLKSTIPVGRRFALLRLVGDHLTAPQRERLLPATPKTRTQRQKFQRAFAQEFLCPYSDLVSYLKSDEPSDEAIENAAHYFDVSERMIETILVNKGDFERSYLC
ncbi:MAG: hypothetical protein ABSG91_05650 [Syntrophobacteraceae bacterium]|jgi:hypothetical protein